MRVTNSFNLDQMGRDGIAVVVGGRSMVLSRIGPADIAAFEAHIRSARYAAIVHHAASMPPHLAQAMIAGALSGVLSDEMVRSEMKTHGGQLFILARALGKKTPGFQATWLDEMTLEQIAQLDLALYMISFPQRDLDPQTAVDVLQAIGADTSCLSATSTASASTT